MTDIDDEPPDETGPPLAEALRSSSREAAETVDRHVEGYDEVLSTVLLGDIARWYWRAVHEGTPDAPAALRAATVLSDLFVSGGEEMETAIATGFLEGLPHPDEEGREVVEQLPPPLREWLRHMENWKPSTGWNPTR
jgi:hypothetical protein